MNNDLLTAVKHLDPVDTDEIRSRPIPYGDLEMIVASGRDDRPRPARRWLSLSPRLAVVAAGLAIVAALVQWSLPSSTPDSSTAAVRVLDAAAATARRDEGSIAEGDGFAYFKLRSADLATVDGPAPYSALLPTTTEQWVAADGSGRVRTVDGTPTFPGPRDEARWHASGRPEVGTAEQSDRRFEPGKLDDSADPGLPPTRELPTDAAELAKILGDVAAQTDVPIEVGTFERAARILMQSGSSPELRAALYTVVSGIEGVKLDGSGHDPLGRAGIAVSIDSGYSGAMTRYTLLFDPDTSQPQAYVERLLEPVEWSDGELLSYVAVEADGHVSDVTQRPQQ